MSTDSANPKFDTHFRKLERLYSSAPITRWFGSAVQVREGWAEVRLVVRPEFHHAARGVHGAVQVRLLDDAAFFAANSTVTDVLLLTVSLATHFLRPVASGELIATGRLIQSGAQVLFADSELRDAAGHMIARASGTFMRSRVGLNPDVGYL